MRRKRRGEQNDGKGRTVIGEAASEGERNGRVERERERKGRVSSSQPRNTKSKKTQRNVRQWGEGTRKREKKRPDSRNHANRLPHSQSNPRQHTSVQSSNSVLLEDVTERSKDGLLSSGENLGIRRLGHGLHLDSDDLGGMTREERLMRRGRSGERVGREWKKGRKR